jgi:energy-coupling factor transport system permease protein
MGFDFYIKEDTWLHRFDPRVKIILTVVLMFVVLSLKSLLPIVIILSAIHAALISAKIPINRFQWVWKMMLPVTIMIIVLWPFFYHSGKELVHFGILNITSGGLLEGTAMALRICALGFACFILLFTTDQNQIVRGLVKMGLPYTIGLTFAITLRYLPTFFGIIGMVIDAQKARGLDLNTGGPIRRMKSYMPVLVAVLITGLKTSENLSNALETRAFSVSVKKRTYFNDIRFRAADGVATVCIIGAAVLRIYTMVA